jgi:chromosome segregation ATPase
MIRRAFDRLATLLRRNSTLRKQVADLERANAQAAERLAGAHHAKQVATSQADELRDEKERLRLRVNTLKGDLKEAQTINARLEAKIGELQEELEEVRRPGPR